MKKIQSQYVVRGKVQRELEELKGLVRDFIKETVHVPFRAVDCNQEIVYTLWDKLTRAVGEENDRK
jgi:hypothetical protein